MGMTTKQLLQGIHDWALQKVQNVVYDISAAHPDGQGNPTPYADLTAALGTGGVNIPEDIRKGGMSIKFIQGTINYTVVKTEGVTEEPTGTEIQNDPSIESGTYKANQLNAFSALPTTPNSSLTYYLAVTETVDEQEVTTYTTWVITYVQSSDNKYVQYRLKSNTFSTDTEDWEDESTEVQFHVTAEALAYLYNENKALRELLTGKDNAVLPYIKAQTIECVNKMTMGAPDILESENAGAPSVANVPDNWNETTMGVWDGCPRRIGQQYVDKASKKVYYAVAVTGSTADWVVLN